MPGKYRARQIRFPPELDDEIKTYADARRIPINRAITSLLQLALRVEAKVVAEQSVRTGRIIHGDAEE